MKNNRIISNLRIVIGIILIIISLTVCWLFLSVVGIFSNGSDNGLFQLLMIYLWIPQSIFSIIQILLSFFTGKIYRLRIILICCNAIYIPLYYTLGLTNLSIEKSLNIITAFSVISSILYPVVHIRAIIKKTA